MALRKAGRLDSIKTSISFFIPYFNGIDSLSATQQFYVYTDTVKYTDGSFGTGQIIVDPNMEFDRRKIGNWTFCYPSGKRYSKGNFSLGAVEICQSGGPNMVGYSFKTGRWAYWYENTFMMAEGIYEPGKETFKTTCRPDTIHISNITPKWKFFDSAGVKMNNAEKLISKINDSH